MDLFTDFQHYGALLIIAAQGLAAMYRLIRSLLEKRRERESER